MPDTVSVVLVGVGGYGGTYVQALLDDGAVHGVRIAGVVDPYAERAKRVDELCSLGVPMVPDLDAFYAAAAADLAVISSPIHLHCPQTCAALAQGSSVLCEKPLGATIQEAHRMIAARDAAERFVAIGYQWSFSATMQALKADILKGDLGAPRRLRTLVLWPRNEAYFARNSWAGAKTDGRGHWILDSPVNNATAHYLHNMFYVTGERLDRSVVPVTVTAELYRANPIANYDTGVCRATTENGVEILFFASHSVADTRGPEFVYEFEEATVTYAGRNGTVVARFADGSERDYGDPQAGLHRKLWDSVAAVRGEGSIACGPEAASSQTLCMNGMQESVPEIVEWPAERIRIEGEPGSRLTVVDGLGEALADAYSRSLLPNEAGYDWARAGGTVDLRGYTHFPCS
jgi:predicted dehydrogenase